MAAVRALLARVNRLEQAKAPGATPFELAFGSVEQFAAATQRQIETGFLDASDGMIVVLAVRQWHTDQVWGLCRSDRATSH